MERSRSNAVKVYYDVGNSTNNGFDILREIRWLGKDKICQIHLKDKGMLGEGQIPFKAVMRAIAEIGFDQWANLETSVRSTETLEADQKKNLEYVRSMM
jgi:sugar phosphate isomerase/epimerase